MKETLTKKLKKVLLFILYYYFARLLPVSYYPGGRLSKKLRYFLCRQILKKCGTGVNIEHGADFGLGSTIEIGNCSSGSEMPENIWDRSSVNLYLQARILFFMVSAFGFKSRADV